MSKFKVGDKIRCVENSSGGGYTKGNIYIVKRYDSFERVFTTLDDRGSTTNGTNIEYFELVTEDTKTLEQLIDEANKGELATEELSNRFGGKIEFIFKHKSCISLLPGYAPRIYRLKKKEFIPFTTTEKWKVSVDDCSLHIGCKKFLVSWIKERLVDALNDFGHSDHLPFMYPKRKGIKFEYSSTESYMMSYETAEQILKALKEVE